MLMIRILPRKSELMISYIAPEFYIIRLRTLYTLERLRSVTSGYLLIGTMIVPDKVENELGMVDFRGGRLLFMPGLDEPSRSVMARHFTDNGLEIMDINTKESWPWR